MWGFLFGISALWFLADDLWPQPLTYFSFRFVANQYSGVIAFGAMSLCMILATRPRWLEGWLNGLDKGYRLHKWLGITALVAALTHFWFTKVTKWMVGWGWLTRPGKGHGPQSGQGQGLGLGQGNGMGDLEQWLNGLRGTAESVGEWAFYLALVLIVMALVKRIPYRIFVKLHKWLALAYLCLVFHALVLIKFAYWSQPIGGLMMVLMAAGTVSAILVLGKRVGASRRYPGTVTTLSVYPKMNCYRLEVELPGWPGHLAGQFAFIHNPQEKENPHPFTMASDWRAGDHSMQFLIKNLGVYTSQLEHHFQRDKPVVVEGPYGCFTFQDSAPGQIWVGAGVGITPFMAQLARLAATGGSESPVDAFYCYRDVDPLLLAQLRESAQAAKVRLHPWSSHEYGRLSGEVLRTQVSDWQNRSVWFCGGVEFARQLQRDLRQHGLPARRFHQEYFTMR